MDKPKENFVLPDNIQKYYEEQDKKNEKKKAKRNKSTPLSKEENESIKVLLDEPIVFECPTRWRRFLGIKTSKWSVRYQPYETLVRLGREYADLFIDESAIKEFGVIEAKRLSVEQSLTFAKIAAIAVTGTMPFESIIRPILTRYFYKRLNPNIMIRLCSELNKQGDYANFINTIRSTRGRRLTEPVLIDQDNED